MGTAMKKSLSKQIGAWFLGLLLLTVVVSTLWNYYSTRDAIIEVETENMEACAKMISGTLDNYGLEALRGDKGSDDYTMIRQSVRNQCRGFRLIYIIIYSLEPKTGHREILLEVASNPEADTLMEQGKLTVPAQSLFQVEAENAFLEGSNEIQRGEWSAERKQISWRAVYRPKEIGEIAVICMTDGLEMEISQIREDFLTDILTPTIVLSLAFLILVVLLRRRVAEPIRSISERMKSFAKNSTVQPEPLNIHSGDEIEEIAVSFEKMTADISTYVRNIERLTQERLETGVQMNVAGRIQFGMVPERKNLKIGAFWISALTRPAKSVGGDFYDCFRRDDGHICLMIGDVSGKGISGAIFMALVKTMVREKLAVGLSPAEALNRANVEVMLQNPEGLFATVFAAEVNLRTGEMRYANAGHNYPVLLGGEPRILKPNNGIALGLFDDAEVVDEALTIGVGQGLLLYTDGLTEAINARREAFGMGRLLETLKEEPAGENLGGENPAEEVLMRISRAVGKFCEGVEPFDDIAALMICQEDEENEPGTEEEQDECAREGARNGFRPIPAALSSFDIIRETVFACAGNTEKTRKALLACDEALANIVNYSGATELSFACEKREDGLEIVFVDNGIPFDPTAEIASEKQFEHMDNGGMGLNLIRQTVSSFQYEQKDGKNLFTMIFPL